MKIDLKRTLHNQQLDLLLQQLFTGSHVPESLVGVVRSFQEERVAQGIEDELNLHESLVKRCEIQIGTLHLDLTTLDEEKVRKYLNASEQTEKGVDVGNEQAAGQINWQFTGVNQFGAVMIRVKERNWQVEFSRLQRRISALITDEAALRPKAHQALYEEMKKMLQPMASSAPSQLLILQGVPGLGKSHCTEHYFYHEAHHHHQMVAWLSGESKEAFLRDWEALADQLRSIDSKRKGDSDTTLIRHWCEKQLGQWLFIIDDVQIEMDWLKEYLPQKGGHVLITTSQPSYNLPQTARILSFSPLSSEDSVLLLKAWLGKYWEASGYVKEAQALRYFSEALGGSPALLTQIALLVRKKGLSFERVMGQFQTAETRNLLLTDTIFDQLKGQTFLECVKKSWRQWVTALFRYYPQFTYQQHEAHLKQFIGFLKQQVAQRLKENPQVYVDEKLVMEYWQGVWASLSCAPLDAEQIRAYLNLLPLVYDKANHRWVVSVAGLHALACQGGEKGLSPALPEVTAISLVHKEKPDLPHMPSGVNLTIGLEHSSLSYAEIALFTTSKPGFTTWRLPTTNPYFIPRPALTEEIAEKLPHKTTREKSAELVLAAASGMGGIGKTELARHFITTPELSSHYKKRFWFNAMSASALRNEFHDFASYLGLIKSKEYIEDKALIHRLHNWFNLNPGWLMILDNADEYNSIAQWIPKEGGAVLITTREPNPGTLMDEQIVKVPLLTVEEAVIWLYRLAQRELNTATEAEQQAARALVENLGYLPLAIAQSAAYLREQKTVLLEEYQKNFLELLLKDKSLIERDKPIDKGSDAYSRLVIANTWKLSLEMIEAYARKKGWPNVCPWLLAACSYLAPKDIPLGLLEYWFKAAFKFEDISPQWLSYLLDEYIAQLLRYSLCERAGLTSMISMHRLVQEVLQSVLIKEPTLLTGQEAPPAKIKHLGEQKSIAKERVFSSVSVALANYSAEFTPLIEDWRRRIDLISHLQIIIAAWETLNRQDKVNPEILILLYGRLVEVQLGLRADAKESLMLCRKQLVLCEKHYGPEHREVAIALANFGIAYGDLGDAQQKKILLKRALPIDEHCYGPKHPHVATTLMNLSNAYGDLGDAKQQKILLERALLIFEQHYDPEHPEMATALINLGDAYGALGDAQQQKSLLERALRIDEQHYGPEHPHVATTLMNLGNAYGALGDAQQQKRLLERALRIKEHYYGPEHPAVAITLTNLGNAYGALGDAQQQKSLLERALSIFEHHYGPEHPHVATTLMNLGNAYGDLGNDKQQKILLERALRINEQHYGPEHPHVASTLVSLGTAYGALGDAEQQKSLLERALPILEQHYGSEHPAVATTLTNLGNAYGDLEDAQQQKRLLERALRIKEHYYGPEHPAVAITLTNLGNAYGDLGDAQQKKILLERALRIKEHYYGSEHPEVAVTLINLGNAYGDLGDAKQKKILLERALRIEEHYYGSGHPHVALTLVSLGNAYGALGDVQQQKILLERALPIIEQHYGPEHPKVAITLTNLGNAYGDLGNAQQQKILLKRALRIEEHYYGPEHPEVAITLNNLAIAYGFLGDAQQQKCLLERRLSIFEQHYGPEHPKVAITLTNLGNAYGELGNAQQQKSLLKRALPILEHHYGPEHAEVATTLVSLGIAYGALGDAQQQKSLLERALPIFEQHYDSEHPEMARTLSNLGNAYGDLGDAQQQKSLLERALHINEHYYGPEHPEVALILINLSNAYGALSDAQQQKSLLERALHINERYYGPKHPEVTLILANLGIAYGALGDAQQQKRLLERALRIKEHYYGPEHPEVAITLANLGTAYGALGDVKQQKSLLERALPIIEQHYGPEHPEVAIILTNLGNAYGALGDAEQQKCLLKRALPILENHYGPEHPEVAKTLNNLGNAYGALGDAQQQKRLLGRALPILEHHYGPEHSEVAITLFNLSNANLILEFFVASSQQAQRCFLIFQSNFGIEHPKTQMAKNLISLIFQAKTMSPNLLSPEQQFFHAVVAGDLNVVQDIIEKQNFSMDFQEPHSQRTALHLACISQQRDIIAYLLFKLARFDIKDKKEKYAWEYVINTPLLDLFKTTPDIFTQKYSAALNAGIFADWGKVLRMAVVNNYLADVRFLIEVKGIDINSVDANPKTRYTALHLAVIRNKTEIAKYLVSKDADINALDASKKTPLDYIKPEQKELLALFHRSANGTPAEECGLNFEKLHL